MIRCTSLIAAIILIARVTAISYNLFSAIPNFLDLIRICHNCQFVGQRFSHFVVNQINMRHIKNHCILIICGNHIFSELVDSDNRAGTLDI